VLSNLHQYYLPHPVLSLPAYSSLLQLLIAYSSCSFLTVDCMMLCMPFSLTSLCLSPLSCLLACLSACQLVNSVVDVTKFMFVHSLRHLLCRLDSTRLDSTRHNCIRQQHNNNNISAHIHSKTCIHELVDGHCWQQASKQATATATIAVPHLGSNSKERDCERPRRLSYRQACACLLSTR
jgi:hypothetical protein